MKARYIQKGLYIFIAVILSLSIPLGFIGCGAGSSSDSEDTTESGKVVIALTDAAGDFVNYTVDVDSITLTKVNGTVVRCASTGMAICFNADYQIMPFESRSA